MKVKAQVISKNIQKKKPFRKHGYLNWEADKKSYESNSRLRYNELLYWPLEEQIKAANPIQREFLMNFSLRYPS